MGLYDQRRTITKAELRSEIEQIISRMIPGNSRLGPDESSLRKASYAIEEILTIVDLYSSR